MAKTEIGRNYLGALLQVANRMADYLEGLTPDQRDLLEVLAEAPRRVNDGWITARDVRFALNLCELAPLGAQTPQERGLLEQRGEIMRITPEGTDLLVRIERREEADETLQAVRQMWSKQTTSRRRTWAMPQRPARLVQGETSQARGERIRSAILAALQRGPMRPKEIKAATGLTRDQVNDHLLRLREAQRVQSLGGTYVLVEQRGGVA